MFDGVRCVLSYDSLFIPIYIYSILKSFLPISNNNLENVFKFLLKILLTIIIFPHVFISLLILAIYSDIVRLLAKLIYSKTLVDFAYGGDALYCDDSRVGRGIIPAVYYIEQTSQESATLLMEHFKRKSLRAQRNHPRLQCIFKEFMGYIIFLRDETISLDFITYFEDYDTEEKFQELLNKKISSALPLNNKFLWEITIGRKSIQIQGKSCIPVVFRLHHALGDGMTLMTLLMSNYSDDGCENIKKLCDMVENMSKNKHKNNNNSNISINSNNRSNNINNNIIIKEKLDFFKIYSNFMSFIFNTELYFNFDISKTHNENSLHGQPTGEVSLMMNQCQSDVLNGTKTVDKIKTIKTKLNVCFNDVILGLLGASLTKHFINRKEVCPWDIVSLNPYNLKSGKFNKLLTFNHRNEPVTNLGNNLTIAMIPIPIRENFLQDPKRFIFEQNKCTKRLQTALDLQFMFWMVDKLISIIPLSMIMPVNKLFDPSILVSNLPSLPPTKILGHDIVDMTLSTVHTCGINTCVTFYSYKDIFHISTLIDKGFVSKQEQQMIADNFMQLVHQIYEESL